MQLSYRIAVDKVVFDYLKGECKTQFLENNPSYDGKHISDNQLMRAMIKTYLGKFHLENDRE